MKKIKSMTLCLIAVVSIMSFTPSVVFAKDKVIATTEQIKAQKEKASVLITRLNEIDAMDKSVLSGPEKKQLRKEVRTIKSTLNEMGEGVYLSVGGIIIIILLLILLL